MSASIKTPDSLNGAGSSPSPLFGLVGKSGTFLHADLREYACVVTGTDIPPWDDELLVITYLYSGRKVEGAMIPVSSFTPDPEPNAKVQGTAD